MHKINIYIKYAFCKNKTKLKTVCVYQILSLVNELESEMKIV